MKFSRMVVAGALVLVTACSGGAHSGNSQASAAPAPTNSIAFPLFVGSSVLSTRTWRQPVSTTGQTMPGGVFSDGAGTYEGHEVVAQTQAVMPALEGWLHALTADPPNGYTVAVGGSAIDAVRGRMRDMGVDFAVFERKQSGRRHDVLVLVIDPRQLDAKAGPVLGLIDKFKLLPQSLRDPIDKQAKAQTGFTVTQATQPNTPIGAAVAALHQLRDAGGRGVVLIDAVKQ